MGGYGSGRTGGRPTSGACGSLILSMRGLEPIANAQRLGHLKFECDGDEFTVHICIDWTAAGYPHATLRHPIRAEDEREIEYRVDLVRVPCRYGGVRWYWHCPVRRARAFKLFLPRGGQQFLSRRAYGLAYGSQRGTALDRAHLAKSKIENRLWWDDRDNPCRAPHMRQKTFERLLDKLAEAEDRIEAAWLPSAARFMARVKARRQSGA
jgi:hypothetical protein